MGSHVDSFIQVRGFVRKKGKGVKQKDLKNKEKKETRDGRQEIS